MVRAPLFGLFTPVPYFYAFSLLAWPGQLTGVAATAVVAGLAQASTIDESTPAGRLLVAAVIAANMLPLLGFAWFLQRYEQRNEERVRALAAARTANERLRTATAEAREANVRLRESLAENEALQEQLVARAREDGVRDERRRMAREIHDTLAQGLTGIISQLRAAEHAGDDPPVRRRHVVAAADLARESLAEARRSVHALRPEPLRTARLGEALAGVSARWSRLHGVPVRFTTTGNPRELPPDADIALLRAAQEALSNVARHAAAGRVGVTLSYMDAEVALDVRDDGRGFTPAPTTRPDAGPGLPSADAGPGLPSAEAGFGLVAMRQRIEALDGTVEIESEPGSGTGISVRVPALPGTGHGPDVPMDSDAPVGEVR